MEMYPITHDDIMDVSEMTETLEKMIGAVLEGNSNALCFSALISATINIMISQCKSVSAMIYYKNIFMEIFDKMIEDIKNKKTKPIS